MAVFSFYLMITTIKEIQYAAELNKLQSLTLGQYNTFTMNSAMCAFAVLSFIATLITGLASIGFTECFQDARVSDGLHLLDSELLTVHEV